jgi:Ca2+-binding RTX toxin-like protein
VGTLDTFTVVIDWNAGGNAGGPGEGTTTLTHADLTWVSPGEYTFHTTHQYRDDNATGDPSNTYTIRASVTDDDTGTGSDTETVLVQNVNPVIASVTISATQGNKARPGEPVTLSALFSDVGTLDTHHVRIDWDDGHISDSSVSVDDFVAFDGSGGGSGLFTAAHAYDTGGFFTVTVTVTDDDTGTVTTSTLAWVTGMRLTPDGVLQIVGSSEGDHVTINKQGNGFLKVHADFLDTGNFQTFRTADVNKIIAYLCQGDDHLTIAGNVAIPAIIHGDAGNDHLKGGDGPAVLLGGCGDDKLVSGSGSHLLIGGLGSDALVGGSGRDVLIGGRVEEDDDLLTAALAAWNSNDDYADRVDAIEALLTVVDDEEVDKLNGGAGLDLFFSGLGDDWTDRKADETVL